MTMAVQDDVDDGRECGPIIDDVVVDGALLTDRCNENAWLESSVYFPDLSETR